MTGVSAPFISRPIATSLLAIAILLGGLLGYRALPVSALPQVDFPTILVTTQLPGASPDVMESLVTASLERQLGQVPSLASMTSTSSFGYSQITLQFALDRDIDGAAEDVQAAINAAGGTLPHNLPYPPVYSKVNPADTPILVLALTSDSVSVTSMSDLADTFLAQRLSEIAGVGHVTIEGGLRPAIRIRADIDRLAAYGLGLEAIRSAITNASVAGATGSINGPVQAFEIGSSDQITVPEQYLDTIVAWRNSAPVRLRDVATVESDLENTRVAAAFNNKPAVVIDIQRQPGANIVATVARLSGALEAMKADIPKNIHLTIVSDRTDTIRASVADVQFTLVLSVVLVVGVVLLFLGSVRSMIIAGVALPLSLIATFGVMWYLGFSIDNLSLMALTIGTGFVIDDAIVMIENIHRYIEKGMKPLEAAFRGAAEIGFTVISLTASLIAVFIPLLFMTGLVGRLFREFALTLTTAVIVSAVVSLTLTPMMAAYILRPRREKKDSKSTGWALGLAAQAIAASVAAYMRSLAWVLRHQGVTLCVALLLFVVTGLLYVVAPKGFLPEEDTGLISVYTLAGQDISFPAMKKLQDRVAAIIRHDPDVAGLVSLTGVGSTNLTPNSGSLTVVLKPLSSGRASGDVIIDRLRHAIASMAGISATFQAVQDIQIETRQSRTQYQYTLIDTDAQELSTGSAQLVAALRGVSVLRNVSSDRQNDGLAASFAIDRQQAGRLNVSVQGIDDTFNDAFAQRQIATIYAQANQYRVILELDPKFQADPSELSHIYVSASDGTQVPLGSVGHLTRRTTSLMKVHQDQLPSITIYFDLAPGASLGEAITAITDTSQQIGLSTAITGSYSGAAAEFAQSLSGEPWLILGAAIAIYIVLGVLYESAIHPLTIISTLPSAGIGALLALRLFGMDLSLVALIGIILLMGIVKKNAILMIDFAIEARRAGATAETAIVDACRLRFRPIMMTTLAALLGAVPLALAHGSGAELRTPLGIAIIGGLLLSQIITLYTTPVIYLMFERLGNRRTSDPR